GGPVTADDSFNPGAELPPILAFAQQADGKILIGGAFTKIGGQSRGGVARLNANGTLDDAFIPFADDWVQCIAVQPDGKILIGGWFLKVHGQSRAHLARLNPDGTLDDTFNPGANNNVYALLVQSGGKILVS